MNDIDKIIQLVKALIAENAENFKRLRGKENWNSFDEIKRNFGILKEIVFDITAIIKAATEFVLGSDGILNANDKERVVKAAATAVNTVVDIPIAPEWLEQMVLEMLLSIAWDALDKLRDKVFGDKLASYSHSLYSRKSHALA